MTNSLASSEAEINLPAPFKGWSDYHQFILYRREWDAAAGKFAKRPCSPLTGRVSNAHDKSQWVSYPDAVRAQQAFRADGVGFVIHKDDPFWFADADHCWKNGEWSAVAQDLSQRLAGAAYEISGGKDGLHFMGTGDVPKHSCKNIPLGLEFYTEARFIALTFESCGGDVMADLTPALAPLVDTYFPFKAGLTEWASWTEEPVSEWCGPSDDEELLKRALGARGGADVMLGGGVTFKQLWEADEKSLSTKWPSESGKAWDGSSADASLAARLAFWTGKDCARIERMMRESALAREKWDDRPDWLADTIMRACGLTSAVYSSGKVSDKVGLVVPPPPRPGHPEDDLGAQANVPDKVNHVYLEAMLRGLTDSIQYDEFSDDILLNGAPLKDNTERELWMVLRETVALNVSWELYGHVLRYMAYKNKFHPILNYLEGVETQWDGVDRCETWLIKAGGVKDTPYSRAVSKIFLLAAVKRVREPGCKFDELIVLEGPQGFFKSTTFSALVPDEKYFSDSLTLDMDTKEVMEALRGVWIAEVPELSRLSNSEVDHVKALASRRHDRARPAYARTTENIPRQAVFGGTTNSSQYLRDVTGNRRFWPLLVTRHVDVAWILSIRDQLWAEAAVRERAGESIRLHDSLWAEAAVEQNDRLVADPYADVLQEKLGGLEGRIDSNVIWALLGVPVERRPSHMARMGDAMKRLGWDKKRFSINGQKVWKYWRGNHDSEITIETVSGALQGQLADVVPIMPKEAGK